MRHFLTGSRVYGTPGPNSDTDMVILSLDPEEVKTLESTCDTVCSDVRYGDCELVIRRFGTLNLIICTSDKQYEAWEDATFEATELSKNLGRGLTRSESIRVFQEVLSRGYGKETNL